MKSKIVETAGYISIALVLALTLVLSFSAIDFNSDITAHAAAPSENTLNIYPGSTSILAPGFSYDSAEIYYFDSNTSEVYDINVTTTLDVNYIYDNPGACFQFIFYVDTSTEEDIYLYLDGISLPLSAYGVASDNGWGDQFFIYTFMLDESYGDTVVISVSLSQFLDEFGSYDWGRIYLYDIRLINSDSGGSGITDNFFSIVGDGISFGFESIAGGITYTVDNLFFEDGNLTDFSVIIFCMTGISLALAIIKYILRIIFSFGGIKL